MPQLNTTPGSSTPKQRQSLHRIKRRRAWSDAQLHDAIGADSTTHLSAKEASASIERLSGMGLPNPPGEKPGAYAGKRKAPGVVRMITDDQVDQIERLMLEYFHGNKEQAYAWLHKNFGIPNLIAKLDGPYLIRSLGSSKRAGQVIRVLKDMVTRNQNRDSNGANP